MKYFIRTITAGAKEDEQVVTEKEVLSLASAKTDIKEDEFIHICRHEEGLPCSLVSKAQADKI